MPYLNKLIFLHKNNKYTIVDTGTSYGVALYDHIALDGSKIKKKPAGCKKKGVYT